MNNAANTHYRFQALFDPAEEGGFVVTFPDLGQGATQGETETEAMEMAQDFLACVLADYVDEGTPIPAPKDRKGTKYRSVELSALAAAKIQLREAFARSGIRKAELARRLDIPKANIDRLFDPGHSSRIEHLEAAARAIGGRLVITIDKAA